MIEVRNLCGGYRGQTVVRNISLFLPNGQITVLVGPNGCGKSTLLRLCCGQLTPSGGEILVDKQPFPSLTRTQIARAIAYLPQSRSTPDITVQSLVLHGRFPWLGYPRVYREQDREASLHAMRQTGIIDKRNKLIVELSGGERQKAYLAMLLAQGTGTVLLDEPSTYLDVAHQLELLELLKLLKEEGKAVGVVLHDLNMALDCADTLAVMKNGALLSCAAPKETLSLGTLEQAFGVRLRAKQQYSFFTD